MNDTQRLAQICRPNFDTACFAEAVALWNREFAYNNERVGYLDMTLEQRMWVNRKAQEIKCNS